MQQKNGMFDTGKFDHNYHIAHGRISYVSQFPAHSIYDTLKIEKKLITLKGVFNMDSDEIDKAILKNYQELKRTSKFVILTDLGLLIVVSAFLLSLIASENHYIIKTNASSPVTAYPPTELTAETNLQRESHLGGTVEPVTQLHVHVDIWHANQPPEIVIGSDDIHTSATEYTDSFAEIEVAEVGSDEVEATIAEPPQPTLLDLPDDYLVTLSDSQANSYLALVNRNFKVASDFSPEDLSDLDVPSVNGPHIMRETAARAAEDLFQVAYDEENHIFLAASGYRSYLTQLIAHEQLTIIMGEEQASRISAKPGHSEHQLGLALDITVHELYGQLMQELSLEPEGEWLRDNAHRFGFIIRYPEDREEDTGFIYEPWHIRYVGVDAATVIYNYDLILEEYLDIYGYRVEEQEE